jgi:hypothetical protein
MKPKRASTPPEVRRGAFRIGGLINGLDAVGAISRPRLSGAKQTPLTALDKIFANVSPIHPRGLRAPFSDASGKGKGILRAAQCIIASDPKLRGKVGELLKPLKKRGYPHPDLLGPLLAHRLWPLNVACAGDWKPGFSRFDTNAEAALGAISHPLLLDFQEAYRAIYAVAYNKPKGHKILRDAWQGDLISLRSVLEPSLLSPSERFLKRYAKMIEARGIVDTVVSVLEQPFELERTVEYLGDKLTQFKTLPLSKAGKAKIYGEFEPVVLYLPRYLDEDTIQRQSAVQAQETFHLLRPERLAHHQPAAPEGSRWHLVLGLSPLDFILFYLFDAQKRFAPYLPAPKSSAFSPESAAYRAALNILAHCDLQEAQLQLEATVAARPSSYHAPIQTTGSKRCTVRAAAKPCQKSVLASGQGQMLPIPGSAFNPFAVPENSELALNINDPDLGCEYVAKRRARYDQLIKRGLLDTAQNPMARAFPGAHFWSEPYSTAAFSNAWHQFSDPLGKLHWRYSPHVDSPKDRLSKGDEKLALDLACRLVETPIPTSMARSLGLARWPFPKKKK